MKETRLSVLSAGVAAFLPLLVAWGCTFESKVPGNPPDLASTCLEVAIRFTLSTAGVPLPVSQVGCENAISENFSPSWTLKRIDAAAPNSSEVTKTLFGVETDSSSCFARSSFTPQDFEAFGIDLGIDTEENINAAFEVTHKFGTWFSVCPPMVISHCDPQSPESSNSTRFEDGCVANASDFPGSDPAEPCTEGGANGDPCADGIECCSGVCEGSACVGD